MDYEQLTAWRGGDQAAGSRLIRRHFASVYRFFRSKAPEEAEDLAQRTFLAAVESRDDIRPELSFRAYLFGIARNRLLMFVRSRKSASTLADDDVRSVDLTDSPEGDSARREERRLVLAAMRRIPLDYQVALEMFYWEDLSVDEIAAVLQAPPGTIKSRLSRGRALLREQIVNIDAAPHLTQSTLRYLADWIRSMKALASPGATDHVTGR